MKSISQIVVSVVAALALWGCGQSVSANPDVIKSELAKRFPDLKPERITPTQYGNLFEVYTGTEIFYTDAKATFVVTGAIIDLANKTNVTEQRMNKLSAIKFTDLPFENAIKIVRGNGERKIAVFEDPLCGYCKRFEAEMNTLENVTLYVFLYPILAEDSTVKSNNIWCSPDRNKAWLDWMLRDKAPAPAPANCTSPVAQNVELGRKLRVNGTPASFFEDGERLPGAQPKERFEAKLASIAKGSGATPSASDGKPSGSK